MQGGAIENYGLPDTQGVAMENYNLPYANGETQSQPTQSNQTRRSRNRCGCPSCYEIFTRDGRLLRSMVLIIILANVPFGNYILYPFTIFSTWTHEMCHGMAALMMGGSINSLKVYSNGSGLAEYTILSTAGKYKLAFIASAGYGGAAVIGGILLLFRRSVRGPRIGLGFIGVLILVSTGMLVRNTFGLSFLIPMGVLLIAAGWKLPKYLVGDFYALLAATCCLNAVLAIRVLYSVEGEEIGGQIVSSDASVMADYVGMTDWFWATIWLCFAVFCNIIGFMVAYCSCFDGSVPSLSRNSTSSNAANDNNNDSEHASFSMEIS